MEMLGLGSYYYSFNIINKNAKKFLLKCNLRNIRISFFFSIIDLIFLIKQIIYKGQR